VETAAQFIGLLTSTFQSAVGGSRTNKAAWAPVI